MQTNQTLCSHPQPYQSTSLRIRIYSTRRIPIKVFRTETQVSYPQRYRFITVYICFQQVKTLFAAAAIPVNVVAVVASVAPVVAVSIADMIGKAEVSLDVAASSQGC